MKKSIFIIASLLLSFNYSQAGLKEQLSKAYRYWSGELPVNTPVCLQTYEEAYSPIHPTNMRVGRIKKVLADNACYNNYLVTVDGKTVPARISKNKNSFACPSGFIVAQGFGESKFGHMSFYSYDQNDNEFFQAFPISKKNVGYTAYGYDNKKIGLIRFSCHEFMGINNVLYYLNSKVKSDGKTYASGHIYTLSWE